MKIPFWKKWLSYIYEFHIESAPSEINPHLYVSVKNGRYQLCTENAVYSHGDLYYNFDQTFAKINWEAFFPQNALILGFGLGSIPILLEKKYKQQIDITGVELDDAVVYLASKYGLSELKNPLEVVNTDALLYLQQSTIKYDLLIVDIFLDDKVPEVFESEHFIQLLKENITDKGIVMFNKLAYTPAFKEQSKTFYEQVFKKVFPEATFLEVHKNWMLLNQSTYLKK